MSDGMFGTPTGFRTYDKDQADLALLASQTQHQQALAGLNKAQAETMLRKQKSEEDLLAIAAGQTPGKPGAGGAPGTPSSDPKALIDRLYTIANLKTQIGQFDDAGKLLVQAANATRYLSASQSSEATAAKSALDAHLKKLEFVRNRLVAVKDPVSYGQAIMQLQADPEIGKELPPWLKTYNQKAIDGFVAGSKAKIDEIRLGIQQAAEARQAEEARLREKDREARRGFSERRTAAYEANVGAREKAGAAAKTPSAQDVSSMQAALKAAKLGPGEGVELKLTASELADRALQIQFNHPNLSRTEAQAKAIEEAAKAGELTPEPWYPTGKGKFVPQQGSVTRPLAFPKTAAEAVRGKHYRAPDGSLVKYLGGGNFETVVTPMKAKGRESLPPPSDVPDDEEE